MKDVKTVALAEQYLAGPGSWIKSACSLDVTDTIFIKYIYILIQDEGSQGAKYFELSKPLTNGSMTNCCEGLVIWVSAISIFHSLGEQQLRGKLVQCYNCYTCNWIPIYDELSKYVEDEM